MVMKTTYIPRRNFLMELGLIYSKPTPPMTLTSYTIPLPTGQDLELNSPGAQSTTKFH